MEFVRRILPLLGVALGVATDLAVAQERIVESMVPALSYGRGCTSTVELRNLAGQPLAVDIEGHRASGALVGLAGQPGETVRLAAGERATYKLDIDEETESAWAKVRERGSGAAPRVAVSGVTECVTADQLRTVRRDVAFPTRNPWYSSDTGEADGSMILLINTAARAAKAMLCYSSGGLYSVPGAASGSGALLPVCTAAFEVQIPPFGSRIFPLAREGSTHLSLKTEGESIVLEMLRPVEANVRVYTVDSTIRFGSEVPETPRRVSR